MQCRKEIKDAGIRLASKFIKDIMEKLTFQNTVRDNLSYFLEFTKANRYTQGKPRRYLHLTLSSTILDRIQKGMSSNGEWYKIQKSNVQEISGI